MMFTSKPNSILLAALAAVGLSGAVAPAADVSILLPLHRVAYQTNETIDVSVARSDAAALAAGELTLSVSGDDASKMSFVFPVVAVPVEGKEARRTEHLHLNGRLLRPGKYAIEVTCDGATAKTAIEVFSHIRRSDFKLIAWGAGANGKDQALLGEDSVGFNLVMNATQLSPDDMIRGGADFMRNCTMSGGHQMDLRMECDWSDPYVLQGGEARVVNEALRARVYPNCAGVHFYDEPGLTWWKDPKNADVMVPFNVPSQDRTYKAAFGADAPHWSDVKPNDLAAIAKWNHLNRWKFAFMEAAWKYSAFGVARVDSRMISATQSQYGWMAYADGYYFNVARQLPVISGHGGYDDGHAAYFLPSFFHEMGRARDVNKPVWYMPTWYNETPDQYRLEQYLSFITDLQGMEMPPTMAMQTPDKAKETVGVVETNKLMARLGTVFTTMRPTRSPVAMLYSISQDLGAEVRDMQDSKQINKAAYEGGDHVRAKMLISYLAGKTIHVPFWPIVEEDVLDGELAANHKVVIVAGIDTLDAKVVSALEAYAASGGVVLVSDDSKIKIKGATPIGAEAPVKLYHEVDVSWNTDPAKSMRLRRVEQWLKECEPYAKAIEAKLKAANITPDFDADSPAIVTQRQGYGDIDYLFAVNATPKADDPKVQIQSATATLSMPADGRPVYDAIASEPEQRFAKNGDRLAGKFTFGPGQMRVFARTARPIDGVQVQPPVLFRDFTMADAPIRIETNIALVDGQKGVLFGSAPLRVRLIDPLGQARYDLYRSTDRGTLKLDLPLAANDPAGKWTLEARELLSGKSASATFAYQPAAQCGAMAGATHRAVYFGDDREHIFRLFRTHRDFTAIVGKGDYDGAVDRLRAALEPWGAQIKSVKAADVKVHIPSELASKTWSGLGFGRIDPANPNPAATGFEVRGPTILIGTPEDNALIKFAFDQHFLPYQPDAKEAKNFPGPGRGYIAWQRDAVSYGEESITLIGYDAAGMAEAVGSMYEAAAGIDPLTPYDLPAIAGIAPATTRTTAPQAAIAWRAFTSDRVSSLKVDGGKIVTVSADGVTTTIDGSGKIASSAPGAIPDEAQAPAPKLSPEQQKVAIPTRVVKRIASDHGLTAIAYWGGTLQILDDAGKTQSLQVLENDISDVAWLDGKVIVGLADGSVQALAPSGVK